jgi:isopentenyldiphosphate isomerase
VSEEEMLAYYDDDQKEIGKATRSKVHMEGLLHKVVHCWVVDSNKQWLYFQQRAFDKKDFPGLYDISAAGHIDAGEDDETAAKREIGEEIGLIVESEKLKLVGSIRERVHLSDLNNNEICQMYLYLVTNPEFYIGEEVEKMVKIPVVEYKKYVIKELDSIVAYSLDNNSEILLHSKDFCFHNLEYNNLLLTSIENGIN